MTSYTDSDADTNKVTSAAIDILNSGEVNFAVQGNGSHALAEAVIEVNEVTFEDGRRTGGYTQALYNAVGPTKAPTVFVNESLLANSANPEGTLGDTISVIVHETLHHDDHIDRLAISATEEVTQENYNPPDKTHPSARIKKFIEEAIVRDVTHIIDVASPAYNDSLISGAADIEKLFTIPSYAEGLTEADKNAIRDFFENAYVPPTVEVDGRLYSMDADGNVTDVTDENEVIVPDDSGLSDTLSSFGDAISGFVSGIGEAIAGGLTALGTAISAAVTALGELFTSVIEAFTGENDPDEGTATDVDNGKPLILDLDGDGVEISISGSVSFDMDNDGFLESTHWVSEDDAFLVLDLNADGSRGSGDGVIDQTSELILTEWLPWAGASDLQALATFDQWTDRGGNQDGVLNHLDAVWSELRAWQDLNQNGIAESGELLLLGDLGITQISLVYDDGAAFGDIHDDVESFGSTLLGSASIVRNGVSEAGALGDVSLAFLDQGWREVETEYGYYIEFENSETVRIAELGDLTSSSIDIASINYDGAVGDLRDNIITASGHIASVQVTGGVGNDTINGGWAADFLSGDEGADVINGGGGNDVIFFDADDVSINGGTGVDTAIVVDDGTPSAPDITLNLETSLIEAVYGGAGDDAFSVSSNFGLGVYMSGGDGEDTLDGGAGDDQLFGDAGDDDLSGNRGDDVASGGSGEDTVTGGNGDDLVLGGDGADSLIGEAGDDQLLGDGGDDHLNGEMGDDFLLGGDGNDTILGGVDDDELIGAEGDDVLNGGSGDDFLDGGEGDDSLVSGSGDNYLSGGVGNDTIVMHAGGDNYASGGEGDDDFQVSDSNYSNTIQGGVGQDVVYLSGLQTQYDVQYAAFHNGQSSGNGPTSGGTAQYIIRSIGGSGATLHLHVQDVEQVQFGDGTTLNLVHADPTTDNSDTFYDFHDYWNTNSAWGGAEGSLDDVTSGFIGPNSHNGNFHAGDDFIWSDEDSTQDVDIDGSTGDDTVISEGGDDELTGGSGDDALATNDGDDTVDAGSGSDFVQGGDGSDSIVAQSGSDRIEGGNQEDTISGGSGADTLLGGSGLDVIYGGAGADVISGDAQGDLLYGQDGSDVLWGGHGADQLYGGDAADRLDGGEGNDLLWGEIGNDTLTGEEGNDTLLGHHGHDDLAGGSGNDRLEGHEGSDALEGEAGNDWLHGGQGDDYILGGDGTDSLYGHDGSDYLEGGHGADIISGGGHPTDIAGYSTSDAGVAVNLATGSTSGGHAEGDTLSLIEGLVGSDWNDTLTGDALANYLDGGSGNDSLNGADGHDRINGGFGADTLIGGDGADVLMGDDAIGQWSGALYIDYATSQNVADGFVRSFSDLGLSAAGSSALATLRGILEPPASGNLTFYLPSSFNAKVFVDGVEVTQAFPPSHILHLEFDFFDLSNVSSSATIAIELYDPLDSENVTLDGADLVLDGVTYVDVFAADLFGSPLENTVVRSSLADSLDGGAGEDYLIGGVGEDTLNGGLDNDTLDGGEGDDFLDSSSGDDNLLGGVGDDTLYSGAGTDYMDGGAGDDVLHADAGFGHDTLIGGAGDDTLYGVNGRNLLEGGEGDDWLTGGNDLHTADQDTLWGGEGDDFLMSGQNKSPNHGGTDTSHRGDLIYGEEGTDTLEGGLANDLLDGGSGNDDAFGSAGNDTIYGGSGNDTLEGAGGFDTLDGGHGHDILTGGGNWDVFVFRDNGGNDTVADFDVANAFERIDLSGVSAITSFADLDANHLTQDGNDAIISDGSGTTIRLTGVDETDLSAGDFIF